MLESAKFSLGMTIHWALVEKTALAGKVEFTFLRGFGYVSEPAFLYVRQS